MSELGNHLARHEAAMASIDWRVPLDLGGIASRTTHAEDVHLAYVEATDLARNEERGLAMKRALLAVRADAAPLAWAKLDTLHAMVVPGAPRGFRTADAFATRGFECYAWDSGAAVRFTGKLARDAADGAHPIAKAVRAYLDVSFFHPFMEGNGRTARLAFEHYVHHAGIRLIGVAQLFGRPCPAGERDAYLRFFDEVVLAILRS